MNLSWKRLAARILGRRSIFKGTHEDGEEYGMKILIVSDTPRKDENLKQVIEETRCVSETAIVFYCDRGAKSMVICRDLWRMGYDAVDLA